MRKLLLWATLVLTLAAGTAQADSIDGRLGFTGKAGAMMPMQDDFVSGMSKSKAGLAAGGGLIFGFGRNLAAEIDASHALGLDVELNGSKVFEARLTDVALGVQYRLGSDRRLVPFFGAGIDFFKGTLKAVVGPAEYDMDWTFGGHVNAGVDYFLTSGIALSAEARGILAAEGDVNSAGVKYDPSNFIGTLGVRLIMPKNWSW